MQLWEPTKKNFTSSNSDKSIRKTTQHFCACIFGAPFLYCSHGMMWNLFVTFLKYMYSDKNCFSLPELAHIPYKIKPKTQRHFLTMLLSSLKQIITVKFEETRILFSILHKHYLLFCHVECSSSFVQGTHLHRLVVFL